MGNITIKWKIQGSEVEYISNPGELMENFHKVCSEIEHPNPILIITDPSYLANPEEVSFSNAPKLPKV